LASCIRVVVAQYGAIVNRTPVVILTGLGYRREP
jgi:hypothetical protein